MHTDTRRLTQFRLSKIFKKVEINGIEFLKSEEFFVAEMKAQ
jgi:hypothetical protein